MIARARFWWEARSSRERVLLGVLGALLAALVLWVGVIGPIDRARAAAVARLELAANDRGRVAAVASTLAAARRVAPATLSGPLPAVIGKTAEAAGFTLSRIDPQGADRVTIAISSARSPALFAWLADLERQGILVERISLRPAADATLSVEGVLRVRGR